MLGEGQVGGEHTEVDTILMYKRNKTNRKSKPSSIDLNQIKPNKNKLQQQKPLQLSNSAAIYYPARLKGTFLAIILLCPLPLRGLSVLIANH